ncbi:hypothetical protein ACJW30_06G041200 [Castanea mollissima]
MNIFLAISLFLIPIFFLLTKGRRSSKRLPPGSLGIPLIGQSLGLLRAMRANTAEKWLEQRITKYDPISKLSFFGNPTVFISGQAANKFVFTSDSSTVSSRQTQSSRKILGEWNILELSGEDHKRVRGALVSFLKPESLKQYVEKIDEGVKKHLEMHWQGKQQVKAPKYLRPVLPLMKILTFDIICSLLFGLEQGARKDRFVTCFQEMIEGPQSKCAKVRNMVKELIHEKRVELEQKGASPRQELITCMLSNHNENNEEAVTEKEIVDNVILVMVAGYDTSAVLITFIMWLLANEPAAYAAVLQEQEEIAKSKPPGEFLNWEDLAKMKYTWRVAMETLRIHPPVFGGFRKALKDIEYGGYLIPKGWQSFYNFRTENSASSVPPYSFVAFGGGPRICPGYEFARIETLVAIHYLITHFTWKLCADNSFSRDPMPVPAQGLPIQLVSKKPF